MTFPSPLVRRRLSALLTLALAAACSGGDDASAADRRVAARAAGRSTDSADGGLAIVTRVKYEVVPVTQAGAIDGVVGLDGTTPPETTYTVAHDPQRCGATVRVQPVTGSAGALADAVVWLDDVKRGKPLPETRRAELTHERCRYEPRVQATVAPTTLNVLNADRAIHLTTITRVGAEAPLATIPFNDDGQVVPSELAGHESGVVEVRCREHPWAVSYLATFDHPYFAVTGADGKFHIADVPPGHYTLKIWHPRSARIVEQAVDVAPSASASVEAKVAVK